MNQDFIDLLNAFTVADVRFLVVGAYALAFHGAPRFTGDLDIFVRSSHENAVRIMAALSAFGFGSEGLSPEDFEKPNQIIQLGVPPVRVDLITSISGVTWEQAMGGSIASDMDGTTVRFIGKNELVMNKRAAGRKKDLADIEALGE